MRYRTFVLSLLVAGLALTGLAGVAAQDATPAPVGDATFADTIGLPELQLTLTDDGLDGVPEETQAGWQLVTFTNDVTPTGDPFEDAWSVEFIMLPEGMTVDDLAMLLAAPPEGEGATPEAMEGMDMATPATAPDDPFAFLNETYLAGGPGALQGQTVQAVIFLEAGDYAVSAFGPFPPAALTVTGVSEASPVAAALPVTEAISADLTITEVGTSGTFDFQVDGGTFAGGQGVVEIYNDSDQPHFVFAISSPEPLTEDDVMVLLEEVEAEESGTPPADASQFGQISLAFITGTQSPGTTQYLAVDLEPGYYVLLCFVPDPEQEGIPHAFAGMIEIVPVGVEDGATPTS